MGGQLLERSGSSHAVAASTVLRQTEYTEENRLVGFLFLRG